MDKQQIISLILLKFKEKIQNLNKSEDINKGEAGDWKKEGYEISHSNPDDYCENCAVHDDTEMRVSVTKDGKEIAHAHIKGGHPSNEKLWPSGVYVDESHRRKGLATAMYQYAEKHYNKSIQPSNAQSDEAKALWAQKDRPFGKSEDLKKATPEDYLKMYPEDQKQNATSMVSWVLDKMPNMNWGQWVVRNHRSSPDSFNEDTMKTLEHYAGSQHIPEVSKVRFDKTHDLASGIRMLKEAEDKYNEKIKGKANLLNPSPETKKIVDLGNGWGWFNLGVSNCSQEGQAMGHCGNSPGSEIPNENLLSLRKEHNIGGRIMHEPHITAAINNGWLGEIKGRANEKPSAKYQDAVMELLKNPIVKHVAGGGYKPESNFQMADLSPEKYNEIRQLKPMIDVWNLTPEQEKTLNVPQKHEEDVENLLGYKQNMRDRADSVGRSYKEQVISDIVNGMPDENGYIKRVPRMALNLAGRLTEHELNTVIHGQFSDKWSHIPHALALSNSIDTVLGAYKNPDADESVNEKLKQMKLSSSDLEKISNTPRAWPSIAERQDLPPEFYHKMSTAPESFSHTDHLHYNLAKNPAIPEEDLFHVISTRPDSGSIKMAGILNPKLSPESLKKLALQDKRFHHAIVLNLKADAETHHHIVDSIDSLHIGEHHSDREIARVMGDTTKHPDVLNKLANKILGSNTDAGLSLNEVIFNTAGNPNTPPETLHRIADFFKKSLSSHALRAAAKNPNISPDTLHMLALEGRGTDWIIGNKKTKPETLHHIATNITSNGYWHSSIAGHPNVAPETLHYLANESFNSDDSVYFGHNTRVSILENPKTLPETKNSILSKYPKLAASEKLDKHDFIHSRTGGREQSPLHGVIHPNGEFHEMPPHMGHTEHIQNEGYDRWHNALKDGYITVGHCGEANATISRHILENPTHPAMRSLRKLLKEKYSHLNSFYIGITHNQHPNDPDDPDYVNANMQNFIKHGVAKPGWDKLAASEKLDKPEELRKEQWDMGNANPVHGWISPEGEYHHMDDDEYHDDFISEFGHNSTEDAHDAGWISVAHTGDGRIALGNLEAFNNKFHPANKQLRSQIKQALEDSNGIKYWDGSFQVFHKPTAEGGYRPFYADTEHFLKHGILRPKREMLAASEKDLFKSESLTKYEEPPKYIGQASSDGKYVAQKHTDNRISWYYHPHYQKSYDNYIARNKQDFLNKLPKEHQPVVSNFIDSVMQSPTRHAVPGRDSLIGFEVPRARHIRNLLLGRDSAKLVVEGPDKLSLYADRHGDKRYGVIDRFQYQMPVQKNEGGIYDIERCTKHEVLRGRLSDIIRQRITEEPEIYDIYGVLCIPENLRSIDLSKSEGNRGASEASQYRTLVDIIKELPDGEYVKIK